MDWRILLLIPLLLLVPRRKLGRYFTLGELTKTKTGKPNVPPAAAVANLQALVSYVLDPLREKLGPIYVTSGYRSKAVNDALRSQGYQAAKNSLHLQGRAADIYSKQYTPAIVYGTLQDMKSAGAPIHQLIEYKGHVHVAI